jgi:hypothetical protein
VNKVDARLLAYETLKTKTYFDKLQIRIFAEEIMRGQCRILTVAVYIW